MSRYSSPVPTPRTDSLLSPCVVVVKTPVASREGVTDRLARSGRRLAGGVEDAALEQERTLAALQEALAQRGVTPVTVSIDAVDARARRALAGARLVISVGGDGTLLAVSHWITRAALLGVNSAPRSSVGYLTLTRRATLARILASIERGTLLPLAIARIEVELEGRRRTTAARGCGSRRRRARRPGSAPRGAKRCRSARAGSSFAPASSTAREATAPRAWNPASWRRAGS